MPQAPRFLPFLALLLLQGVSPACQDSNVSRVRLKLEDSPNEKAERASPLSRPALVPPVCPAAGLAQLQPSQQGTGHHRITLSWNASAPSVHPEDNAVGYCLYRSKTQNAAKKNPICAACEQINSVPFAGTTCVDDLVQDGATYYYVATAISQRGQLSSSSNEITAVIPKQLPSSVAPVSAPLCRAPASSK